METSTISGRACAEVVWGIGRLETSGLIDGADEVEFKSDGAYIDSDDPIIETTLQGVLLEFKTWSISGDILSIVSSNEAGTLSATDEFTATNQECDLIDFEYQGFIPYTFTRN